MLQLHRYIGSTMQRGLITMAAQTSQVYWVYSEKGC